MDLPYYHGCLTKRECEALLLKGGVDGNFLIRDSESVPGALCLCVSIFLHNPGCVEIHYVNQFLFLPDDFTEMKAIRGEFKKLVYNYRIFREKNGYYRIETEPSTPKTIFPNLEELISKFKTPGQGMVVHLSNPIMRSGFCPGARRLNLEANVYVGLLMGLRGLKRHGCPLLSPENTDEEYVDVLP